MDVAAWLQGLGLERYAPAFRDNEIDWDALPKLSAEDLKDLGVVLGGHRRRLLDAIAALGAKVPAAATALRRSPSASRRRAPAADGDVLRSGRLDRTLGAARSRGSARGDRRLSPRSRRGRRRVRRVCRQIHGRRRPGLFRLPAARTRTMPSGRSGRGWASSTPSVASMSNLPSCKRASGSPPGWWSSAI